MRTRIITLRPLVVTVALLLVATATRAADSEGGWALGLEEDGITVHTRPVEGSGIDEFRGVGEVGAPAEAIVALLRDSNRFKDWFPNTSESALLERDGAVSYQYSVMQTPWPISDRDNIFRSVTSVDAASGRVTITVAAAPDFRPVRDDRVRVRKARGSWVLEPRGDDRTLVTFQMHLEPGGGIPEWMINARVVATPFEALTNLRTTLSR